METLVRLRQWLFLVDKEATVEAYAATEVGGATMCSCEDCKNFALQRLFIYPAEVLEFFAQIGVDYQKEGEVYGFGETENEFYIYGGWLHFIGQMVEGEDWRETQHWEQVSETFSLAFTASYAPTSFAVAAQPSVQIELSFRAPWIVREIATQ